MMEEDNLRWLYETYYGMTYDMDRRLGEVLDLLGKRGLVDDTAIVFTSDHGDMLAHRGMLQKRYFYERSVRSCLIFSHPGNWPEGVRISTPVSLVDLFPTFADLTGAPVPDDLPGISLLETVKTGEEPPNRPILCEYHGEGVHAPCFMSVMDGFKYVYVHGHEERLYDLVEDPDEYVNLIGDARHGERVERLRKAILEQFDPDSVSNRALSSQRNRGFVFDCARKGGSGDT
jgi:choline-sulfatase